MHLQGSPVCRILVQPCIGYMRVCIWWLGPPFTPSKLRASWFMGGILRLHTPCFIAPVMMPTIATFNADPRDCPACRQSTYFIGGRVSPSALNSSSDWPALYDGYTSTNWLSAQSSAAPAGTQPFIQVQVCSMLRRCEVQAE